MGLAVADDHVHVTVTVEVVLVDALEYPRTRYIKVLSAVPESSLAEGLKPLGCPDTVVRHSDQHLFRLIGPLYVHCYHSSNAGGLLTSL